MHILTYLLKLISWEVLRDYLTRVKVKSERSMLTRRGLIPLYYLIMLVLQQIFNLSDQKLELQVKVRGTFEMLIE